MSLNFDFLIPHPDPDRDRVGFRLFFYRVWCHFSELVRVNLLFLLCSLPLITLPAAYTGLCRVCRRMVQGEVVHVKDDFFETFRSCFGVSCLAALCTLSGPILSFYLIPFYRTYSQHDPIFLIPLAVVVLVSLVQFMMAQYLFLTLPAVDMSFRDQLRNALLLTMVKLPRNFVTVLLMTLVLVVVILFLPLSLIAVAGLFFSFQGLLSATRTWPVVEEFVLRK